MPNYFVNEEKIRTESKSARKSSSQSTTQHFSHVAHTLSVPFLPISVLAQIKTAAQISCKLTLKKNQELHVLLGNSKYLLKNASIY